ncbi:MAG: hypothetical protein IKL31_09860 [Ruminococcus sp.]|nr:hypothetical protein [Ruminococcus sp.]
MNNLSYRVALGGIMTSVCLLCMFLAGIIPILYLVLPMIAGMIMVIIADEVNIPWAFLTYISVSLLSLFIVFDKEAALIFVMFFGHYPLLRIFISKIKTKILRITVKFAVFNICVLVFFYLTVFVMGLTATLEEINDWGRYGGLIMLFIVNLFFAAYDFNINSFMLFYRKHFKPLLKKNSSH